MFMRDTLPPGRADVAVLFDKCLRERGIDTDFVGHRSDSGVEPTTGCAGRQYDSGKRNDPRTVWREIRLLWRSAAHYDVVVVRDKPLVAGFLFMVASWRRLPCVYWMSFPMPLGDRMGAHRHWSAGRWVVGGLAWLRSGLAQWVQDRLVLPQARHVFVQSERMRDVVRRTVDIAESRISAVPMGIDTSALAQLADSGSDAARCAPVIAYLGSLDRARQLDVLIDAFALVLRRHPGATLLLVGSAPINGDVDWLKVHAASLGLLDRVDFAGAVPMAQAWERVRKASVCVSPIPPGPLHDVSSPTKLVEYLALGVPVVANDIPDQKELLAACGGGICVPFTAPAFADAIGKLLDNPDQARERARQARPKLLSLRAYEVLGEQVATSLRTALA